MDRKPNKECEKRGDIILLSEIITNSKYWQLSGPEISEKGLQNVETDPVVRQVEILYMLSAHSKTCSENEIYHKEVRESFSYIDY
jgi:hypothetical protein